MLTVMLLAAACTADAAPEPSPTPTGESAPTPEPSVEPETEPQASVVVEADVRGRPASIEVGPVVVDGDLAVLRTAVTATGKEDVSPNDFGFVFFDTSRRRPDNLRLVDTRALTVAPVVPDEDGRRVVEGADLARAGEGPSVFHSAHAAPSGPTVAVLVPFAGLVEDVPVVQAGHPAADGVPTVAQIVAAEEISGEGLVVDAAPLESYRVLEEGLIRTQEIGEEVSVAIDADVLFDFGSADLTPQADAALQAAVQQIAGAEGVLRVVGHTDDQGPDDLNQRLSDERAASVAARLAALTDLGGLEVVQEGRGEREPVAEGTSEEARAANRRVELVVTRAPQPIERDAPATGEAPPAQGPVGTAEDGVRVERADGSTVGVAVESVRAVDRVLVGTLQLDPREAGGSVSWAVDAVVGDVRGGFAPALGNAAVSVTLLQGAERIHALDYVDPGSERGLRFPLADLFLYTDDAPTPVTVVWPRVDADVVTVDRPVTFLAGGRLEASEPWRIEGVPVTEGPTDEG